MQLVACTLAEQGAAILEILNHAIVNTTALYDYRPRKLETMTAWFEAKRARDYPVWGAVDERGSLLGFASYGPFRPFAAFKYSVEHSVYVRQERRGLGVGRALMQRLLQSAEAQQYHVMIGGIDASNASSVAFHEKLGFTHAGTIRQAGFKFGRWLDLAFYERRFQTPQRPVED
jgi:phosphinothricin acetyltransferase